MSGSNVFTPHSEKQERALFSDKPILLLGTGTQYGKTTVGALRMKMFMHTYTDESDNFLITSPNYKTMYQSTLPPFLKIMDGMGRHDKKLECFKMHHGGTCWFRTATDPDSVIGVTNIRHIWGDESGKYSLYFWENIQARAEFKGAKIDLTTSPYALNWIFKDLIKPWRKGLRPDVELIQAASWENPYHSFANEERRLAKIATMDPRRFKMLYGGQWDKAAGLVYDCWDDVENLVEPIQLPTNTIFYAGVDWGYTEPFALVVRAITPSGHHFQVSEFYKSGLTVPQQVEIARQKKSVYGVKRFFCGHERPENIELFNQNGLPSEGVPEKDIRIGTDHHYELMKTRRYKIFKGSSPYTLDEQESYHYPEPEDLGTDDDAREQLPVGQNDHCMSANRFVTLKTYRSIKAQAPHMPDEQIKKQESQIQRIERLRRRANIKHTEDWS